VDKKQNKKSKKLRRMGNFRVFPVSEINWNKPPRKAVVDWGHGRIQVYRFEHLTSFDVKSFWKMSDDEKAVYLYRFFDRHHRLPGCQGGKTVPENLSYVDRVSHTMYNKLIFVVARWSSLSIEKVKTRHIAKFLKEVYPALLRVYMNQTTCRMKSLESLKRKKNLEISRRLTIQVGRFAGLRFDAVAPADIWNFLEYLHSAVKRLAVDHETGRLRHLFGLVRILNDIWLPVEEPISHKTLMNHRTH
jgi:hypothetical protein